MLYTRLEELFNLKGQFETLEVGMGRDRRADVASPMVAVCYFVDKILLVHITIHATLRLLYINLVFNFLEVPVCVTSTHHHEKHGLYGTVF